MGYNKDRGDTLNVVNSPFAGVEKEIVAEVPLWKRPEALDMAKQGGKYLLAGAGAAVPVLRRPAPHLAQADRADASRAAGAAERGRRGATVRSRAGRAPERLPRTYQNNLDMAKQLARDDPKVVANVVKDWVNGNE